MKGLKNYSLALVSFLATAALTLIGNNFIKTTAVETYLIFATGTSVSLALALIEQQMATDQHDLRAGITAELSQKLDLYRMVSEISDTRLKNEVYSLARGLSSGVIPPFIATGRVPMLYETAQREVYASNASLTKHRLYQWADTSRYRGIVETSERRSKLGVSFARTFFLCRGEVINSDGEWDAHSLEVLTRQVAAGIKVRIIWEEDLEYDNLSPHHRLDRNFTIFDGEEAVDTRDVQTIYIKPSDRLHEFLEIQKEQIKYSELFIPSKKNP